MGTGADWASVGVTLAAVLTAIVTLWLMRRQTTATEKAANAAKDSADALGFLNRAELDIKNWKANLAQDGPSHLRSPGPMVSITFDIKNVGHTAARIDQILVCVQDDHGTKAFRRQVVDQDAVIDSDQAFPVETESFSTHPSGFAFSVWGRVIFSDMTGKQRWKRFGRACIGKPGAPAEISMINLKGFNSAGEWNDDTRDDESHYQPQDWNQRRQASPPPSES